MFLKGMQGRVRAGGGGYSAICLQATHKPGKGERVQRSLRAVVPCDFKMFKSRQTCLVEVQVTTVHQGNHTTRKFGLSEQQKTPTAPPKKLTAGVERTSRHRAESFLLQSLITSAAKFAVRLYFKLLLSTQ